jgi:S-formylglutathione hydrolase FrmB
MPTILRIPTWRFLVVFCFLLQAIGACSQSAQTPLTNSVVQESSVSSKAMHRKLSYIAILPNSYLIQPTRRYPVVYLLHGYSGNQRDWITKVPELTYWSSLFEVIIVTPDGGYDSWYIDSPLDTASKYDTYMARELPAHIDSVLRTLPQREGRAITGLSMGGHGAMWLAAQHPDIFGAVGSMSGGVDIRPFSKNWGISKLLGAQETHPENWDKYAVINNLQAFVGKKIPMMIDCGSEDFFFKVNQNLHQALINAKIPHDYIVRPGAHTWEYWSNAVGDHLLFFRKYFNGAKKME